jgi:hypothetical protein
MTVNFLFFYIEFIEMRIQGISYFKEIWNILDLLHFIVFLCYGVIKLFMDAKFGDFPTLPRTLFADEETYEF